MGNNDPTPNPTETTSSGKGKQDNRSHARYKWGNEVQIVWLTPPALTPSEMTRLKTRNISAGGIALRSRCMVHPGQRGVALLGHGTAGTLVRGIEVRHCVYDSRRKCHIVGCSWAAIPVFLRARVLADDRMGLILSVTIENEPFDDDLEDASEQTRQSA